ncbi:MAG: iron ABC transporter permease [Rhodothermales bacterium]
MKTLVLRYAGLLLALAATLIAALALGTTRVAAGDVAAVIWRHLTFDAAPAGNAVAENIVWLIRMPRALLAIAVGGGLAVVGIAMQTLVRNPLAEPYILGLSSGASAGASLFYLGFLPPLISLHLSLPLAAFVGGLGTMAVVYFVAREDGDVSVVRLLLAGVAMSALMGAVSAFATFASPELEKMKTVMFWLLGSIAGARWGDLGLPLVSAAIGAAALMLLARPLDALLLGDEAAASLGVPVRRLKQVLLVLSAFVTGSLVAAAGAIGFVGLIIPHAVRSLVGVPHRRLVPACFLTGAIFLVWADTLARLVFAPVELPIGVVTALCGVPFFLWLIRKRGYQFG